ncbi:MAG TPA: glycerol kinase GlpK [Acidimicrobiales bacterium]|jgi:glycerol kinase|nr:glycerol kinase GlpK [Acidimicrobiales bacterium]
MASRSPVTIAVDAGTTGVRALVVDDAARVVDVAYRELGQRFPRPGWVEHDADEIWGLVRSTLDEVVGRLADAGRVVGALGVTNQRETVVAWDRATGRPLHRAIVWQDRRTAKACRELIEAGLLPLVRDRTGLVLDPYFSATKMRWLLGEGGLVAGPDLALGTVDSWVLWNLTGGARGGVFATDTTNAARTLLFDIVVRRWSAELCEIFGVPQAALAEVRPSCGRFGRVTEEVLGAGSPLTDVPIGGMAGDQHAALFGQACFRPGMTKVTFGTGSFVLMNAGPVCPPPVDGLITTVAWDLGDTGAFGSADGDPPSVSYALEGSVFASGAGVQWLRDGLGIIDQAADTEPLARSVPGSDGVVVVPAFTGLGSPHWDPGARGTIVGLSRGTGRAHLARAMVEAMSFQVRDVVDAMAATATAPSLLRVDGGASAMDLLLQLLADQTRLPVVRPRSVETTAVGAATLAGLAEGMWGSLEDLEARWTEDGAFTPLASPAEAEAAHQAWGRAVDRSRRWISSS